MQTTEEEPRPCGPQELQSRACSVSGQRSYEGPNLAFVLAFILHWSIFYVSYAYECLTFIWNIKIHTTKNKHKKPKPGSVASYDLCPETEQALFYSSWGAHRARLESSVFTLRSFTRQLKAHPLFCYVQFLFSTTPRDCLQERFGDYLFCDQCVILLTDIGLHVGNAARSYQIEKERRSDRHVIK